MALVLVLSLVACGGGEKKEDTSADGGTTEEVSEAGKEAPAVAKVSLGETVSTDIVDFTLDKAELSDYANALSSTFAEPREQSGGGIYTVAKGSIYVCLTFTITNKDRDSLNAFGDWSMDFKVSYKGSEYDVKGYDLIEKEGSGGHSFQYAAVSTDGGNTFEKKGSGNVLFSAGETMTLRVAGIAKFEPDSLGDAFDLIVNIPNSDDEYEYFRYEIL